MTLSSPTPVLHRRVEIQNADEIKPPMANALYQHWRALSRKDRLPSKNDFDLAKLHPVMSHLALIDIDMEPFEARYRIVGQTLVELLGFNPVGMTIDESYPAAIASEINNRIGTALLSNTALIDYREFNVLGIELGYRRMILPLRSADASTASAIVHINPRQTWLRSALDWRRLLLKRGEKVVSAESEWNSWQKHIETANEQSDTDYSMV